MASRSVTDASSTPPSQRDSAAVGANSADPKSTDPKSTGPKSASAAAGATSVGAGLRPLEPMDPQVTTIQPGGGAVMQMELAWGRVRRALLSKLRPGYVAAMRSKRRGQQGGCPFDPIDPRDVKYYANQATYSWAPADDPFRWRDKLPFVRVGLAELLVLGSSFVLVTLLAFSLWWPLGIFFAFVTACIVWFFRDPPRRIPTGVGQVVSPADGLVVRIAEIDDPVIGPAIEIGIFLSIFNVHANRAPVAGRVLGIEYRPGKFLNALRPESEKENERLEVRIEETDAPHRMMRVRQITGQFARRIVCWVRPGDRLGRGEMFGMIKLGSRTELVMPREPGLELQVAVGTKVKAGSTLIASYGAAAEAGTSAAAETSAASAAVAEALGGSPPPSSPPQPPLPRSNRQPQGGSDE